jgi:hypothetical protein
MPGNPWDNMRKPEGAYTEFTDLITDLLLAALVGEDGMVFAARSFR